MVEENNLNDIVCKIVECSFMDEDSATVLLKKQKENMIEEILTRLDDQGEQLDYLHGQQSNISGKLVPQMLLEAQKLTILFKKIDIIHEYVQNVQNTVVELNKQVDLVESEVLKDSLKFQMKKKFVGFFKRSQPESSEKVEISFNPEEYKISSAELLEKLSQFPSEKRKVEVNSPVVDEKIVIKKKVKDRSKEIKAEDAIEIPLDESSEFSMDPQNNEIVEGENIPGQNNEGDLINGEDKNEGDIIGEDGDDEGDLILGEDNDDGDLDLGEDNDDEDEGDLILGEDNDDEDEGDLILGEDNDDNDDDEGNVINGDSSDEN